MLYSACVNASPPAAARLGLGPNTLRVFAEALLTQPLGRGRLHANAGLYLHDEVYRPHDQREFLSYGLAADGTWGFTAGVAWEARSAKRPPRAAP